MDEQCAGSLHIFPTSPQRTKLPHKVFFSVKTLSVSRLSRLSALIIDHILSFFNEIKKLQK